MRAQVSNANRAHVVNATGSVNAASVNVANAASAINGTSGNGNPNGINGMNGMNGMNGVSGISDVNGASRALRYPPISSGVDVVESSGATRDTGVLELDGADDKGGYKRTFSPRKRQRGQRRGQ